MLSVIFEMLVVTIFPNISSAAALTVNAMLCWAVAGTAVNASFTAAAGFIVRPVGNAAGLAPRGALSLVRCAFLWGADADSAQPFPPLPATPPGRPRPAAAPPPYHP